MLVRDALTTTDRVPNNGQEDASANLQEEGELSNYADLIRVHHLSV